MDVVNFFLLVMAVICLIVAIGAFSVGVYDVAILEIGIAVGLVLLSKI